MTAKKTKTNIKKEIKSLVLEILKKLDVSADIEVTKADSSSKEDGHYKVVIQTQDTGLLIGKRGEVLNSFQLVLGVMLYKKLGEWIRVVLDVGDYRKQREESIKEMASRIVEEVKTSNQSVVLPRLTPYERRIVHLMLSDNKEVVTESVGEGKDRRLVIKPRE